VQALSQSLQLMPRLCPNDVESSDNSSGLGSASTLGCHETMLTARESLRLSQE
jgi:hypothetical protein